MNVGVANVLLWALAGANWHTWSAFAMSAPEFISSFAAAHLLSDIARSNGVSPTAFNPSSSAPARRSNLTHSAESIAAAAWSGEFPTCKRKPKPAGRTNRHYHDLPEELTGTGTGEVRASSLCVIGAPSARSLSSLSASPVSAALYTSASD